MFLKAEKVICLLMWLVMAGYGVWGRAVLPDVPMAVHFGLDGQADGFAPRDQAMATLPALALALLVVLFWVAPALAPKTDRLERSAAAYGAIVLAVMGLLMALQIVMVLAAYGFPVNPVQTTVLGSGVLMMIIGNYLPKARINHIVGIRTPWTLGDERVWDKTHRFAGPLFMAGGAIIAAGAFLAPLPTLGVVATIGSAAPAVVTVVYSWSIRRRD